MLIQNFLGVLGASNDWHFDRQSFFRLVKFRTSSCLVDFVHQVNIEVVNISVLEHQSILVYVELCLFQTLEELDVNRHSEGLGQLVNLLEVRALDCVSVALPRVLYVDWVRVDHFEFGLDYALRPFVVRFLIEFLGCLLFFESFFLLSLESLFLSLLFTVFGLSFVDLLLKLGFLFAEVHVSEQLVLLSRGRLDHHLVGSLALALNVLEDLVVGAHLFPVFRNHFVNAVNGGVRAKLFEFGVKLTKLSDVSVEHAIVGHAQRTLSVLIWLALRDTVGQGPSLTLGSVWARFSLLPGLLK